MRPLLRLGRSRNCRRGSSARGSGARADLGRGGDRGTSEHGAPFGNTAVRRDQHGVSFVAAADQLGEQMRRFGLQRQVAEFVDD